MSEANTVLGRLKAALADRYALEREIGAGGMATVYLAQDLKHHRKVAVKVLRPDLAASLGVDRFNREITIAAALTHPHILTLIDSGEADGFLYYVMPYVEGPTLRSRLVREGELPVAEAVRILRDVTDAVAAAHAQGVVHRDLKPENIMLSGRHALVADFGVAKAVREATGRHSLTTAGVALGTPTYMAPEQAAADPLTDHRADLYALGVLAYEMLTGEPPFVRSTPQAVLAAHVTEAPVPVTERRGTVPPALASLVMRCLEKRPADRPQRAEELLGVLESLSTPSGGMTPTETQPVRGIGEAGRKTRRRLAVTVVGVAVVALGAVVAWALWPQGPALPDPGAREPVVVLPFEVRSSDPGFQGIGVDAADRIAAALKGANLGRVVDYRPEAGGQAFTESVGRRAVRETGAGTLVTGVIAQRGDRVEVQASVVRGSDLGNVWTLGPEQGSAADPTPALDAIRERVLGAVGWWLGWTWTNPGIFQPPPSLEVFRLSGKALELFLTGQNAEALPLFRDAFARDTTWLHPLSWLWLTNLNLGLWQERDSVLAFWEARRERLFPGDALRLDQYRATQGSPEEEVRATLAVFAAESMLAYDAMRALTLARRPMRALEYYVLRDTATVVGREWRAWDNVAAQAYHMLGRFEEELALARAAKTREPRNYGHWAREVSALAALGRTDEIERVITESHGLETQGAPVHLMDVAAVELSLHGWTERARVYAERAVAGVEQWPEALRATTTARNIQTHTLRILGRHQEVVRIYDEQSRAMGEAGLGSRILGMRDQILMGDTVGALALVDSARTQPLTALAGAGWTRKGQPLYYGAHILSLLGRGDEAVAMLREALNNGQRLGPDEPLQWYWAPIKDHPGFQELVRIR
jgi:tRNA A-37 threonylcarbamoyl transferase component Bud32/tetratricopeptide (TPR) repeat protein/TolB-like protein